MNADHDNALEALIDRELKSLPPLRAPETLAAGVMAKIAARSAVPWYRRAWQSWPIAARAAALVILLALFAGLCFAGWKFSQSPAMTVAAQKVSAFVSAIGVAVKTLGVLGEAAVQVIHQLRTGVVVGLAAAVLLSYAMCVALGSAWYRFAYARR